MLSIGQNRSVTLERESRDIDININIVDERFSLFAEENDSNGGSPV